jgi:polyhydroxybutyrate depolymerase
VARISRLLVLCAALAACVPDLDRGRGDPDSGVAAAARDSAVDGPSAVGPQATPDRALASPDAGAAPAPQCTGKAAPPQGETTRTTKVGAHERSYLVRVPPGYDPARATPLVLLFHGFTSNAKEQLAYSKMGPAADQRQVVVVAPQGMGLIPGWNAGGCCGEPQLFNVDDVGFVKQLLGEVRRDYCIDDRRVYAAGMSNGAFFAHRLGCELSAEIAAIGAVAGGLTYKQCNPARPLSVIAFHGTADYTVPYQGGTIMGFEPVPQTIGFWVKRDGCSGEPKATYKKGAVTCMTHGQCSAGTEVTLCTVEGSSGTHSWPGAGPWPSVGNSNMDIDATAAILDFFAKHTL